MEKKLSMGFLIGFCEGFLMLKKKKDILQNTKITKIVCTTWDIIKIHLERGCKREKNPLYEK